MKFLLIALAVIYACEARHLSVVKRSTDAHFDVHIVERGTHFIEKVSLDLEKNLEIINVPHHNNISAQNMMNDFNTGLSVKCLPEYKVCFLLELEKNYYNPLADTEKLLIDRWMQDGIQDSDTDKDLIVVPRKWLVVDGPLHTAIFLSEEARKFVGDYPLYILEKLPENVPILEGGVDPPTPSDRPKRRIFNPGEVVVPPTCPTGADPVLKIGYVRQGSCDYINICSIGSNGKPDCGKVQNRHVTDSTFLKCLCCPEHQHVKDCACFHYFS